MIPGLGLKMGHGLKNSVLDLHGYFGGHVDMCL